MQEIINDFINFLTVLGIEPADHSVIIPDDQRRYYKILGDGNKTRGSYCLAISDNNRMAYGWAIHHKYGDVYVYKYQAEGISEDELENVKKFFDNKRKENEKRVKRLRAEAAKKANDIWDKAEERSSHPYTDRKNIPPICARVGNVEIVTAEGEIIVYKDQLVIPVIDNKDDIVSIQYIDGNGKKRFLKDGRKRKCFAEISEGKLDYTKIILCEGYSTGVSLWLATNIPVFCAYDAGNLEHVLKELMSKYPMSKFVIAADNDQWTTDRNGLPYNTGLEKANAAKGDFNNVIVTYPDFPRDDPEKRKDFNDLYNDDINKVKAIIDEAFSRLFINRVSELATILSDDGVDNDTALVEHKLSLVEKSMGNINFIDMLPRALDDNAWEVELIQKLDSRGNVVGLDDEYHINYSLILQNHNTFKNLFGFNEITKEVFLMRKPPWYEKDFKPRAINDTDIIYTSTELQKLRPFPLKGKKNLTKDAIMMVAKNNSFNPAQFYIENLKWDGKKRMDNWLIDYCGAHDEPIEYVRAASRILLLGLIYRIFKAGCKFDYMVILEGNQGIGKSTLLENFVSFKIEGNEYKFFTPSFNLEKCRDTNELLKLQGAFIVEIAEMSGFSKKKLDEIKGFLTSTTDKFKAPYAMAATEFPRQCIFVGTNNPDNSGLLHDATGNRRYLPVTLKHISHDMLRADRDQLLAEAYARFLDNEIPDLTKDEKELAASIVANRITIDAWDDIIFDEITTGVTVNGEPLFKKEVLLEHIFQVLEIPKERRDHAIMSRINDVMLRFGYRSHLMTTSRGIKRKGFRRIDHEYNTRK